VGAGVGVDVGVGASTVIGCEVAVAGCTVTGTADGNWQAAIQITSNPIHSKFFLVRIFPSVYYNEGAIYQTSSKIESSSTPLTK
jgi:hypothetical protein